MMPARGESRSAGANRASATVQAPGRRSSRRAESAGRFQLAGTWITAGVAALAPIPFGSADNVWVAWWSIPLAAALTTFDLRRLRPGHAPMIILALAGVAAAVATVLIQISPNLPGVTPHPVWSSAEQLLGRPVTRYVSVDPDQSWAALGRPILLLLAFLCGFLAAVDRTCADLLVKVIGYAGAALAAYGIGALVIDPNSLLGYEKYAYVGDLTATFVNRNTAGTFFGAILILWWVRLLAELDKRAPRSDAGVRDFGAVLLDRPSRAMTIAFAAVAVTFLALLLTRSRAGILLSMGTLFAVTLIAMRHRLSGRHAVLGGIGVTVLVGGFLLELLGGAVAGRIGTQGLVDQGRLSVYASSLAIIRDYPWLGTGLGSFKDVFPAYRDLSLASTGLWDRAHNTPLEIAVELGLPVALLAATLWLAGMGQLLRGALSRKRDADFATIAFGVATLGTLHGLVDFSPQVPGFAVPWLVLIGCGLAQSLRSEAAATERTTAGAAGPAALPQMAA